MSWSVESWLHQPTGDVIPAGDARAPRTLSAAKGDPDWHLAGSRADGIDGFYRRDIDLATAKDSKPSYDATWHPEGGESVRLARGSGAKTYRACVDHHQARWAAGRRDDLQPFIFRTSGSTVEAWSGYRIQFGGQERYPWQLDFKARLKDSLPQVATGSTLTGYYAASDPSGTDAENSVFTNVREALPKSTSIRFERRADAPPRSPEPIDRVADHLHYYCYKIDGQWLTWEQDQFLASWTRLPRRMADDSTARPVWLSLREGHAAEHVSLYANRFPPDAAFGIRLTVHATAQGPANAVEYSERLVDGTLAAFHGDRCTDEVLDALGPRFPHLTRDALCRVLDSPIGPLFDAPAILVGRNGYVQFSPADGRCVVGEVTIQRDSRSRWPELSGELFTVRAID